MDPYLDKIQLQKSLHFSIKSRSTNHQLTVVKWKASPSGKARLTCCKTMVSLAYGKKIRSIGHV